MAAAAAASAGRVLTDVREIRAVARAARRVAVLGIKPEDRANQPAHYVAKYLDAAGVDVVPCPTYYPKVTEILGKSVVRQLRAIPAPRVDVLDVFRRAEDCDGHLEDILAMDERPHTVWLQSGIRNDRFAARLTEEGIDVVQDACLMVEHMAAMADIGASDS